MQSFFSLTSTETWVAPPTRITVTSPASLASRPWSVSLSYSLVVVSICWRIRAMCASISALVATPSMTVVSSLSIVAFFARPLAQGLFATAR